LCPSRACTAPWIELPMLRPLTAGRGGMTTAQRGRELYELTHKMELSSFPQERGLLPTGAADAAGGGRWENQAPWGCVGCGSMLAFPPTRKLGWWASESSWVRPSEPLSPGNVPRQPAGAGCIGERNGAGATWCMPRVVRCFMMNLCEDYLHTDPFL
jgi:hypothetical protein